jgi:hypothetical protein
MKEDTKDVLSILIVAMQLQNDAMKEMAQQIKDMQKALEDMDTRMAKPTEIHNHYHNTYTYPRYPYYTPVWGSGSTGTTFTINGGASASTSYGTNSSNSVKE